MVRNFSFKQGETFLDPCCGSGAFLLSVDVHNPNQIFGIDNDSIAVFIAKINLLLKYRNHSFIPQVYCLDYLLGDSLFQRHPVFKMKFNYIATNPPWGAVPSEPDCSKIIVSKESFSCFFVKSCEQLKSDGVIRFLFPEAILNVKIHKDIRKFILEKAGLVGITEYDDLFSGVTTKYVDIECSKKADKHTFMLHQGDSHRCIDIKTVYETDNLVFNLLSSDALAIIKTVKEKGKFSLKYSTWALGIVTGDNKSKLSPVCLSDMEKIYTGKEIAPYRLKQAKNFILFDRKSLQQVAKDEHYRAPEKLVYKFISSKLVFAYDNTGSLFLNSANILIPKIPSMSIKTVMAFLNSQLFQFLYIRMFGEVKVLKGNLMELPFPEISGNYDELLIKLIDQVLSGDDSIIKKIDDVIFEFYKLSENQIKFVRSVVNGNLN